MQIQLYSFFNFLWLLPWQARLSRINLQHAYINLFGIFLFLMFLQFSQKPEVQYLYGQKIPLHKIAFHFSILLYTTFYIDIKIKDRSFIYQTKLITHFNEFLSKPGRQMKELKIYYIHNLAESFKLSVNTTMRDAKSLVLCLLFIS